MTVTRFAPSPTGQLHVGNIRTALHNWLLAQARRAGASCCASTIPMPSAAARNMSRRSAPISPGSASTPDGEERQSARLDALRAAFERLKAAGRVYPCYETAQELELKRKILLGRGLPPIYDRAALELTDAERGREGGGRRRRTGASGSTTASRSRGRTAFAGRSISIPRSCPIRSSGAPTARGSTCCPA